MLRMKTIFSLGPTDARQLVAPSSAHSDLIVSHPWSPEATAQEVLEHTKNL